MSFIACVQLVIFHLSKYWMQNVDQLIWARDQSCLLWQGEKILIMKLDPATNLYDNMMRLLTNLIEDAAATTIWKTEKTVHKWKVFLPKKQQLLKSFTLFAKWETQGWKVGNFATVFYGSFLSLKGPTTLAAGKLPFWRDEESPRHWQKTS